MENKNIVIDSNVFIGIFFEGDSLHEEAMGLLEYYKECTLIVSYPVVEETSSILTYRFGKEKANTFIDFLKTSENIILVNNDINNDINLFLKFDNKISFTDISLIGTSMKYNADLATFDKQLIKLFRKFTR